LPVNPGDGNAVLLHPLGGEVKTPSRGRLAGTARNSARARR